MKFLGHDEIDPQDAYAISMYAFGWPLSPTRLKREIKYDDRWFEDSLLCAVVKGKAVSQVIGLRIPTRTVDGEELVVGVAGVATLPSYARRGICTKLMQELHDRFHEEGIRMSILNTSESLVAYPMYAKLGYRDATYYPHVWKPLVRRKRPKKSILRKYKMKDGPKIDEAFKRFTRGLYGFVIRQKGFFNARMKLWKDLKGRLFTVETDRGICGYVIKREQDGDVFIDELVVPSVRNTDRVLRELESQVKGDYIDARPLAGRKQVDYFRGRGYKLIEKSWGVCMIAPLSGNLSHKEISRLYKTKEGKLCSLVSDTF